MRKRGTPQNKAFYLLFGPFQLPCAWYPGFLVSSSFVQHLNQTTSRKGVVQGLLSFLLNFFYFVHFSQISALYPLIEQMADHSFILLFGRVSV